MADPARARHSAGHATIEGNCQRLWKFTRRYAHNLIDAAIVAAPLASQEFLTGPMPNESQARALGPFLETLEVIGEALQEMVSVDPTHDYGAQKITAADVREAVERRGTKPHTEVWPERRERYIEGSAERVAAYPPAALPFGEIVTADALTWLHSHAKSGGHSGRRRINEPNR